MLKIREIREIKKMTQDDVVKLSGIKKRSYVDYESGKVDIPFSKLQKIATSLNASIAEITAEENAIKKEGENQDSAVINALKQTIASQKQTIASQEEIIRLLKGELFELKREVSSFEGGMEESKSRKTG